MLMVVIRLITLVSKLPYKMELLQRVTAEVEFSFHHLMTLLPQQYLLTEEMLSLVQLILVTEFLMEVMEVNLHFTPQIIQQQKVMVETLYLLLPQAEQVLIQLLKKVFSEGEMAGIYH